MFFSSNTNVIPPFKSNTPLFRADSVESHSSPRSKASKANNSEPSESDSENLRLKEVLSKIYSNESTGYV